ncbi:MAG: tetratricopeptide repeat protein, partial [Phycisphaerales bacterium]|nr:tetratricopeptide repeat protein [Phycisphaerales bacterium]
REALLRGLVQELAGCVLSDLTLALDGAACLIRLADGYASSALQVEARTTASNAMSYANRFDQAISLLEEARALATENSDRPAMARVELAFVQPYARLGRFSDAVRCAEGAVTLYESLGDSVMAAKSHSNLGVIHRMRGDAASAIRHFDRALSTLRSDVVAEAQLESNRAEALLDLARFREAEAAFRRAIDAFDQTPHRRGSAIVEGNLADLLGRQGRLQASIRHFERAQRMLQDDEAVGDAARLGAERAEVLLSVGLLDEAIDAFTDALTVLDAQGFANEAARARTGLGLAHARRGDLADAEAMLQRAAAEFVAIEARHGLVDAHLALARVLLERGRVNEAWTLLDDIVQDARSEARRVEVAALRARALLSMGDADAAITTIDDVRRMPDADRLPLITADLLHLRGRALMLLGDNSAAVEELEAAVHEIERIRGSLLGDRLRTAWLGDRLAPYHDMLSIALAEGSHRRAFEIIEMVRSRALLDVMQGGIELAEQVVMAGPEDAEESRLVGELTRMRAELNMVFDRMHGPTTGTGDGARREDLNRRARVLEREVATIEGRLTATRRFGEIFGRPIDAEGVSRTLGPGVVLLEYFVSGGELAAIVVRDGHFQARRLGLPEAALAELAERIAFQVDRGLAGAGRSGARSDRLVQHAEHELKAL